MNAKKKWIQDTENSLNGLKTVEINPYLYSKLLNRLSARTELAPSKLIWATATSFVVLVLLNFFIIKNSVTGGQKNKTELQTLTQHFQLINYNTINYN